MKQINDFFAKKPLWQVFIVLNIVLFLICFLGFNYIVNQAPLVFELKQILKVSLTFSLFFSLFCLSIIYLGRCSVKFWEYSEEVNKLINDAATKEELNKITDNEFQKLIKMSVGGPHQTELIRLYTIINTKYKYLNE